MDGYKKIINNRHTRMAILNLMRIIPDKQMLKLEYWIKFKRILNLKHPKRFTEKIQSYKLNFRTESMVVCSDKHLVREYVKGKGFGNILNEQYCVFDTVEEIDLSKLPQKFVLKLSNGSGTNFICKDKSKINVDELKKKFSRYLLQVKANAGREWPYTQVKPVVVAERFLEDPERDNGSINDYKIFCYNGKAEYVICISNRYTDKVNHLVYDTNWVKQLVASEGARINEDEPRPDNLDEMLKIAESLSEEFPFARIDLYSIQGKIYFGEITFFPWSGFMEFEPDEFDFVLGEKFTYYQ